MTPVFAPVTLRHLLGHKGHFAAGCMGCPQVPRCQGRWQPIQAVEPGLDLGMLTSNADLSHCTRQSSLLTPCFENHCSASSQTPRPNHRFRLQEILTPGMNAFLYQCCQIWQIKSLTTFHVSMFQILQELYQHPRMSHCEKGALFQRCQPVFWGQMNLCPTNSHVPPSECCPSNPRFSRMPTSRPMGSHLGAAEPNSSAGPAVCGYVVLGQSMSFSLI